MPLFLKVELVLREGLDVWWALAAWSMSRGVELVVGLLSMCNGRDDDDM